MQLLIDTVRDNAERHPKKKALAIKPRYRTMTWTYGELFDFAKGVAAYLAQKDVDKGDRVVLWASNSPYWIGTFFGCLLRGAIVVPLHTENTPEFIRKVSEQTQPKVFFKSAEMEGEREGAEWVDIESIERSNSTGSDPVEFDSFIVEDDIVEILFTSGTTGEPKGVVLTHKNLVSDLMAIWDIIPVSKVDRVLSLLPLSHIFEQMVEFRVLAAGGFIVYAPALSSSLIKKILKEHRVTKMAAVPEFLKRVMTRIEGEAERAGKAKFLALLFSAASRIPFRPARRLLFSRILNQFGGKLVLVVSGGAALDAETARKWHTLGVNIIQGYGLTETSAVVSVLAPGDAHLDSVGKVIPGVEVKIAQDNEILVRGANVTQGYWKNAEKTKEMFTSDGWLRTGDLGVLDASGYLYIRGRKKFMILTGSGQNVYPEDIEAELNKEPGVKDSVVVALEKDGKIQIHAVLPLSESNPTPRVGFDSESGFEGDNSEKIVQKIVQRVNKRLSSFQQIQSWSVWPFEDFPRTITRKVKRLDVAAYVEKQDVPGEMEKNQDVSLLVRIIARAIGKDASSVSTDTPLAGQGLDSLARIELVARIEEELGVEVDEAQITQETTARDLQKLVEERPAIKIKYRLRGWPRYRLTKLIRELLFWIMVLPLGKLIMDIRVEGRENLKDAPRNSQPEFRGVPRPMILMPNHLSDLDGAAVYLALPRWLRRNIAPAAAADTLFEVHRHEQWLVTLLFNTFPFDRKEQTRRGIEYTGELLDRGWSILLFPEGRIPPPGEPLVLKEGAGVVAVEMRVPVVPVKIQGTAEIFPHRASFPRRRGKVHVIFGKSLHFAKGIAYSEATKQIQEEMRKLK